MSANGPERHLGRCNEMSRVRGKSGLDFDGCIRSLSVLTARRHKARPSLFRWHHASVTLKARRMTLAN